MTLSIQNLILPLSPDHVHSAHQDTLLHLLPLLDLTADIYVISENLCKDASKIADIIKLVGDFITEHSFYRLNVHPFHPCPPASQLMKIYADLFAGMQPFHQEAYSHQSVSRMMILPIIHVKGGDHEQELDAGLKFLRERTMIPCLYTSEETSYALLLKLLHTDRERIYLALGEGSSQEQVARTLCAHVTFDDLLAWTNDPAKPELPHARAVILSEKEGRIYACPGESRTAGDLRSGSPASVVSEIENALERGQEARLGYYTSMVPVLKETLALNNREQEGARVLVQLGLECVKVKDYARAIEQFEAALKSPGWLHDLFTVFLSKAFCHLKAHDISSAQAALNEAEKQDPSSAMVCYYRAHCEFELKDYIEAIDLFQKSLELDSGHVPLGDAYFYMGLSHIEILEYDEGLAMMREAERQYPREQLSPVLYYMGVCYFGKNDLDTAYEYFSKALTAQPQKEDVSSIYLYRGICHKEKSDFRKAIEELEKARDAEEDRLDVHNLLGFCHFKLGEHDKAIACFLRAVEINPGSAIDWANLGVNVRAHGEAEKAIILFKKALSLDPTIGFAKKHLRELLGQEEP